MTIQAVEGRRPSRAFFDRYTPAVARDLIGARLVRIVNGRRLVVEIVETEAYRGPRDPASHAYRGMTRRNHVMFGEPGHAYVYFTMGLHHCLNLTTEPEGTPAAVLIRAAEPIEGIADMRARRGNPADARIAGGPGNLAEALMVDRSLDGEDVVNSDKLYLLGRDGRRPTGTSARVGISAGTSFKWRFFAYGSPCVSKGRMTLPKSHNYRRLRLHPAGVVG